MGIEINYPFGSGGGGTGADPTKLPLDGGTMSVNATVLFPQSNNRDSEIGAWGFGVEDTNGNISTIEPEVITKIGTVQYNGNVSTQSNLVINAGGISSSTPNVEEYSQGFYINNTGAGGGGNVNWYSDAVYWSINPDGVFICNPSTFNYQWGLDNGGIAFADGTFQTTAGGDWKVGGLMNSLNSTSESTVVQIRSFDDNSYLSSEFSYGGMQYFYDGNVETQLNTQGVFFGLSGDFNYQFSFSSSGITFADGTTQTTAGFFNGGNISGSIYIDVNNQGENTLELEPSGITSLSQQVNSFNLDAYGVSGHDEIINPNGVNWGFGVNGALFPDGSTQTSAGIPEAPNDGIPYIRVNGTWVSMFEYL